MAGHFDEAFFGTPKSCAAAARELSVNSDLAQVIDNNGHALTLMISQDVVRRGRLACAEETRPNRNEQAPGGGKGLRHS